MVSFLTVIMILMGVIYGYSRKGTENYLQILKKGLIIGLVIGLVIGTIGLLVCGLAILAFIVITTIEFIVGAFIGIFSKKYCTD